MNDHDDQPYRATRASKKKRLDRWCRGKEGREHNWKWKWVTTMNHSRNGMPVCLVCGKRDWMKGHWEFSRDGIDWQRKYDGLFN